MASIYEILDPTDLVYDHALGLSPTGITDPIGPTPMGISFEGLGWVRTGAAPSVEFSGAANCLGYTSSAALDTYGTTIGLSNGCELPASIDSEVTPWSFTTASCDRARPVWCVED
jgi:hypothetical protein